MAQYLEGYERNIDPGAGHSAAPGNRKLIIHTTQTPPGTLDTLVRRWSGGPTQWATGRPHFVSDGSRIVQLLPLDTCAYTSKNGGINANKAGNPIQIEVVGFAEKPFNSTEYEVLGKLVADLIKAGVGLDLNQCPRFYGPNDGIVLATTSSPVRQIINRDYGGFAQFNGICGHQHLEGNDHWDPGALDIQRVCRIAMEYLEPDDLAQESEHQMRTLMMTKKDSQWAANVFGTAGVHYFVHDGTFIRHLDQEVLELYRALIWMEAVNGDKPTIKDAGFMDDKWFKSGTLIPSDKLS